MSFVSRIKHTLDSMCNIILAKDTFHTPIISVNIAHIKRKPSFSNPAKINKANYILKSKTWISLRKKKKNIIPMILSKLAFITCGINKKNVIYKLFT